MGDAAPLYYPPFSSSGDATALEVPACSEDRKPSTLSTHVSLWRVVHGLTDGREGAGWVAMKSEGRSGEPLGGACGVGGGECPWHNTSPPPPDVLPPHKPLLVLS